MKTGAKVTLGGVVENKIKLWCFYDCEWYAAKDITDAKTARFNEVGETGDRNWYEVNDSDLDVLIYVDDLSGDKRTFREQLAIMKQTPGVTFPAFFATSEI